MILNATCGGHLTQTYFNQSIKKSLKIPKGYSETVNRRMIDKAMAKRTNNNLQNITHTTKYRVTRTPLNTGSELMCFWLSNYTNYLLRFLFQ